AASVFVHLYQVQIRNTARAHKRFSEAFLSCTHCLPHLACASEAKEFDDLVERFTALLKRHFKNFDDDDFKREGEPVERFGVLMSEVNRPVHDPAHVRLFFYSRKDALEDWLRAHDAYVAEVNRRKGQ